MKASGELVKIKAGIEEEADLARSVTQQGKNKQRGTSRDVPRFKMPSPKMAQAIADSANVSTSTVQRAPKLEREAPKTLDGPRTFQNGAEAQRTHSAEVSQCHNPMAPSCLG